jgi:hypothetical protein
MLVPMIGPTYCRQPRSLPLKQIKLLSVLWLGAACALSSTAQQRATVEAPQILHGQFALQGQQPLTESHLKVSPVAGKPLAKSLDLWLTLPGKAAPIQSYQVEMTKKLHMIIVRNDFKVFLHEHPTLRPDGHLVLTQAFPTPGTYLVYADGLPNEMNHQVSRFQFDVGAASTPVRTLAPTGMGVQVGPYEVDLSSVRLHAGTMSMLDVAILKDGKPASDLHPYLGVPGHAVFLNAGDLSYVHVHPMAGDSMDMSKEPPPMPENGPSPSEMMLHLALREAGTYKLWLQFRGGTQLYVAEFTITAI